MVHDFTKRKFLTLPIERQHRKCAEIVRSLYEQFPQIDKEICLYDQMIEWMNLDLSKIIDLKALANRYHWHLEKARIHKREHNLLPQVRKGDQLAAAEAWPISIYLDHIRSAHNVGSIIRTVEAMRLGSIYFSEQTPYIDHKQVQDTAMGAQSWVNCWQGYSLEQLSGPIIVLETSDEAISLYEFIFPETFTLVLGNEEYGCTDLALKAADYLVEIPLRGRKNSLNVANAFAMVASEIYRQKNRRI